MIAQSNTNQIRKSIESGTKKYTGIYTFHTNVPRSQLNFHDDGSITFRKENGKIITWDQAIVGHNDRE